jgi:tetratricopeptide (TPR) repeat protein
MTDLQHQLNYLIKEGKRALISGDYQTAVDAFEQSITISKQFSPKLDNIIGISLGNIGLALAAQENREMALEYTLRASDHLINITENPIALTAILHGLGLDFQKHRQFDCSIIILKIALELARKHSSINGLNLISVISRQLAYSYVETNNLSTSAKLFRISGDLEDQPHVAIDLYKNAAYLYYKEGVREEALNILETAFEKAGIIQEEVKQREIATFQATIAYEILKKYSEFGLSHQALAYSEICVSKCKFLNDTTLIVKILYETALLLQETGKIWQRNNVLKQIISLGKGEDVEQIRQRSIMLLTIHFLELKNYTEAIFYMEQLSFEDLSNLHPQLATKLNEISQSLDKSRQLGTIHTNLYFSRSDLDLPVEQLLKEEEIFEGFPELEKPSSLELEELNANLATYGSISDLKPPSIESLEDLFGFKIEITPPSEITDEVITPEVTMSELISVEEDIPLISADETGRDSSLDQVFSAHQEEITEDLSYESTEYTEFIPQPIQEETIREESRPRTVINIRSEVGKRLQRAGWSVQLNFSSSTSHDAEPDIVAEKGLIRKRKKLIFFAENVPEAEICSFLLQSNPEPGEKVVFLLEGQPREANVSIQVKVITRIEQLF